MAKIVILRTRLTDCTHEMTTAKEKMLSGEWYDAVGNPELTAELMACRDKIYELNRLHPRDTATRDILLRSLIGHMGRNVVILSPFFCDYGTQISIGDDTYINFNLTVLDEAPVTIGSHVFITPSTRRSATRASRRPSPSPSGTMSGSAAISPSSPASPSAKARSSEPAASSPATSLLTPLPPAIPRVSSAGCKIHQSSLRSAMTGGVLMATILW